MRFIFHYPETSGTDGDMLDPGPLRDVAQAAERAGFDALSLTEHPVPGARWLENGGHQSLDPFVGLGYVAAATERLRLLTHLSVAPYRNPFLLAKAAATVDKISDGRFTLGIGAGYQKSEFYALGVNFEERNALFDEILDVLPLHWKGEPFSYQGLHFDARNVIARPRPVQDPIPVWIGGNSKLSRRRVAARAQGWMAMSGGPELSTTARTVSIGSLDNLAGMIREIRDTAAANGRTDLIDVSYSYSGVPSETSVTAEADRHREALAEIEKAGVTWVVISSHTRSAAETISFIETFGETLIP
ncbi:probable F420-dependent oxidoreductase, Rv2161c family [Parafrankia irregularis]|uniref:Probable F420-dependent oxidoreductase, Rv2161c family n=1 Tax=Parafrankia irregularis TaxID=795642 RepID=A0A0S4QKN7_9ACTN|nr:MULTISPECIES: LLM class F420-dependent oxidoreductase [Parafrankia]MBE3201357.1 LLM class F420-dependent oxidoreductase [Parafrankia sp. CH37]CUU56187.1 probable F420-dependent oxidoreductase, Rv2161c family [Parafrankia irregularis]